MSADGFSSFAFSHDGKTRAVYKRGTGPGVVVMHEVPGITPPVAAFARRVGRALHRLPAPPVRYAGEGGDRALRAREHAALLRESRVQGAGRERVEPDHRLAARAVPARAGGVRRPGRGRAIGTCSLVIQIVKPSSFSHGWCA